MKKVWIYKRKRITGWWIGWYESGKRKTKAVPSKALAEHFRQIKYTQLNSDVFTGTVTVDWNQMRNEYEHSKKVVGVVEDSLYEVALTLRHYERLDPKQVSFIRLQCSRAGDFTWTQPSCASRLTG